MWEEIKENENIKRELRAKNECEECSESQYVVKKWLSGRICERGDVFKSRVNCLNRYRKVSFKNQYHGKQRPSAITIKQPCPFNLNFIELISWIFLKPLPLFILTAFEWAFYKPANFSSWRQLLALGAEFHTHNRAGSLKHKWFISSTSWKPSMTPCGPITGSGAFTALKPEPV